MLTYGCDGAYVFVRIQRVLKKNLKFVLYLTIIGFMVVVTSTKNLGSLQEWDGRGSHKQEENFISERVH